MIKIIFFLLLLFVSFQNVNAIFRSVTELPKIETQHTQLRAEKTYEEYMSGLEPYQTRLKEMSLKNKKKSELQLLRQLKNEIEHAKGSSDLEVQTLNSLIEKKQELEKFKTKFQFKKEGFRPQYPIEEFIKSIRKEPNGINRSNMLIYLKESSSMLKNILKNEEYKFLNEKYGTKPLSKDEWKEKTDFEATFDYEIDNFLSNIETFIEEIKKQKVAGAERDNIYKTLMDLLLESKEYNLIDKFEENRSGVPQVRSKPISLAVELQKWKDEPTAKKPVLSENDKKVQDLIDELQYYIEVAKLKEKKGGKEQFTEIMNILEFNPANKIASLINDSNAKKANPQIKNKLYKIIEDFQNIDGFGTRRIAEFYEPDDLTDFTKRELSFEEKK